MADTSDPSQPSKDVPTAVNTKEEAMSSPWISYTVAQAQELRRNVVESTDTVLKSTRSYLSDMRSASSGYSESAQNVYNTIRSEYGHYEDRFFGKVKEGLHIAGEHPGITYSVMAGAGLLLMKRPRRLLFRYTLGQFQSEESLITKSASRVNEMRQSLDLLKKESKKLEERAKLAEEEYLRGRTKLKQVGSQIQNLITSIAKAERQSLGLRENLRELPGGDALKFRAEVASMAAEAKRARNTLTKEVSKLANYGIPM